MKRLIKVAVSGGAGQICYSLLFRIASGEMLGFDQPIALHILEIPQSLKALEGVVLELQDCAYPLLKEIKIGSDPNALLADVDYAILVGAKPRGKGMERADLLQDNAKIFETQGKAFTNPHTKVLVVGNPCNTNALVLLHNSQLEPKQVRSMMRLDQNRGIAQIANRVGVDAGHVKCVAVYGNHSPTMVVDYCNALVNGKKVLEMIPDSEWFRHDMMPRVQKRGAEIIEARGFSSAASAAKAAIDSIRDWHFPTPEDDWFAAGVHSNGNPYGIADDLFFSFPMKDSTIVPDLKVDAFLEEKIKLTEKELLDERDAVRKFLS